MNEHLPQQSNNVRADFNNCNNQTIDVTIAFYSLQVDQLLADFSVVDPLSVELELGGF